MGRRALLACMVASLAALGPASAEVIGIEILERAPFAPGVAFGTAGSYEKIRGIAQFSLDPDAAANQRIVDRKSAPRDANGRVKFESSFILLRTVKARGSTLLYDVNNRGGIAILGQVNGARPGNNDPATAADAADRRASPFRDRSSCPRMVPRRSGRSLYAAIPAIDPRAARSGQPRAGLEEATWAE